MQLHFASKIFRLDLSFKLKKHVNTAETPDLEITKCMKEIDDNSCLEAKIAQHLAFQSLILNCDSLTEIWQGTTNGKK